MDKIFDIVAARTAFALTMAWALMMAVALLLDGDLHTLLSAPYYLFLGGALVSVILSDRPSVRSAQPFLHLVNATAQLIAAGLVGAVRVSLLLF